MSAFVTDANLPQDFSQIYALIDSILPFEACLYYQMLPLNIQGTRLLVGMVDTHDYGAESYVRRQLSFINYSVVTQEIPAEWHRQVLSCYLSHHAKAPPAKATAAPKAVLPSVPLPTPRPAHPAPPPGADGYPTYVIDRPEQLEYRPAVAPPPATRPPIAVTAPPPPSPHSATVPSPATAPPLHLYIDEQYRHVDGEGLRRLQPKGLMQALLNKVLQEGIGRLFFERQEQGGRILWSRDGVLQAVMGDVDPGIFQGVINELKLLTHLSLITVAKPRQVEIERAYQDDRILLRFRVMPGKHGEEATLQVLRGTALRFYQQQQMDKMGRDALDAAEVLQRRLNGIRDRARQGLEGTTVEVDTLPTVITMLRQLECQVQDMIAAYEAELERHS